MKPTLQDLKNASCDLPASQRAELAHFLLSSLEPEEDDWAKAWQEELTRRFEEFRLGKDTCVPMEEVLGRLRERYP